jgi:hypothetical protein
MVFGKIEKASLVEEASLKSQVEIIANLVVALLADV